MTKEEALRFKENWAVVNKRIIEEKRLKTPEQRLRDLTIMFRAGRRIGWNQRPSDDEERVRARWQGLRERHGVKSSDD